MSFTYIASPYTDPDPEIVVQRFLEVEKFSHLLLQESIWNYSPIVHCHEMAQKYDMPTDFEFWCKYNFAMLSKASRVLIHCQPGWRQSTGVTAELEFAESCQIPIEKATVGFSDAILFEVPF